MNNLNAFLKVFKIFPSTKYYILESTNILLRCSILVVLDMPFGMLEVRNCKCVCPKTLGFLIQIFYLGDFPNNLNNQDHLDNLKPKAREAMHTRPCLTDYVSTL